MAARCWRAAHLTFHVATSASDLRVCASGQDSHHDFFAAAFLVARRGDAMPITERPISAYAG